MIMLGYKIIYNAQRVIEPAFAGFLITMLHRYVQLLIKIEAAEPENVIIIWRHQYIGAESDGARHYEAAIVIDMLADKVYTTWREITILSVFIKYFFKLPVKVLLHLVYNNLN